MLDLTNGFSHGEVPSGVLLPLLQSNVHCVVLSIEEQPKVTSLRVKDRSPISPPNGFGDGN